MLAQLGGAGWEGGRRTDEGEVKAFFFFWKYTTKRRKNDGMDGSGRRHQKAWNYF